MIILLRIWKSPSESELIARTLPEATIRQLTAFIEHETVPTNSILDAQLKAIGLKSSKGADPKANRQQIAAAWILREGKDTEVPTFELVEY